MEEENKEEVGKIIINDVKYNFTDLTEKQQQFIRHLTDMDQKINNLKFQLEQLEFSKLSFIDALSLDLKPEKKNESLILDSERE